MFGNQTFEDLRQSLKVFEFVETFLLKNYCWHFKLGIPLSKDFRNEVIQMAVTYTTNKLNMWKVSYKLFKCVVTTYMKKKVVKLNINLHVCVEGKSVRIPNSFTSDGMIQDQILLLPI